jgi:hypothetical protein
VRNFLSLAGHNVSVLVIYTGLVNDILVHALPDSYPCISIASFPKLAQGYSLCQVWCLSGSFIDVLCQIPNCTTSDDHSTCPIYLEKFEFSSEIFLVRVFRVSAFVTSLVIFKSRVSCISAARETRRSSKCQSPWSWNGCVINVQRSQSQDHG